MTETPDGLRDYQQVDIVEEFERFLRRIAGLRELSMRRGTLSEKIIELDPADAVWWIDQLIRGALWGQAIQSDALLALGIWLIQARREDSHYETFQRLFEAAYHDDRPAVVFLLRDSPPHKKLGDGARLPEVRLPFARDVSLGEQRTLASGQDRRILDRLLMSPSELVIEKLLRNPNLRLQDILTIASRRPTTPEILTKIALSERWVSRPDVREALVMNPYSPTGISLKLLPTLHIRSLRRIRDVSDLHASMSEFAALLVELREERTAPLRV